MQFTHKAKRPPPILTVVNCNYYIISINFVLDQTVVLFDMHIALVKAGLVKSDS